MFVFALEIRLSAQAFPLGISADLRIKINYVTAERQCGSWPQTDQSKEYEPQIEACAAQGAPRAIRISVQEFCAAACEPNEH
jgi:hypothetical protein